MILFRKNGKLQRLGGSNLPVGNGIILDRSVLLGHTVRMQGQLIKGLLGQGVTRPEGAFPIIDRCNSGTGHSRQEDPVIAGLGEILCREAEFRAGRDREFLGGCRNGHNHCQEHDNDSQTSDVLCLIQKNYLLIICVAAKRFRR